MKSASKLAIRFTKWIASFEADCEFWSGLRCFSKKTCNPLQNLQSTSQSGLRVLKRIASFQADWHPLHVGIVQKYVEKSGFRVLKRIASFEVDCDVFLKKLEIRFKTWNPLHKVDCEFWSGLRVLKWIAMFFKKNLQSTSKLAICFTKWIASFEADCKIFEKKHAIRFKTRNRKLLQDTTMYVCIVCKVDFFRIDQSFQKSLIDFTVKDFTVKKRQNVPTYAIYLRINY